MNVGMQVRPAQPRRTLGRTVSVLQNTFLQTLVQRAIDDYREHHYRSWRTQVMSSIEEEADMADKRTVADTIADSLTERGVDTVFTLIGTANFPYTLGMRAAGSKVHRARHENGVVSMAAAWARLTGRVGICTLSKGAGLTHGLTALVEARKSHTRLLVLAADTPASAVYSSPAIPQAPVVEAVGITADRIHSPESAKADIERAYRLVERTRQPVVLMISSDIVKLAASDHGFEPFVSPMPAPAEPAPEAISAAVQLLVASERPVLLAGQGVLDAGAEHDVRALARRMGGMLTTTILAHGLFSGESASLGISGGYAKPETVAALARADLVVSLGASLNDWTTRAGSLFPSARLIQVDLDPTAFGRHHSVDLAIQADVGTTARAIVAELDRSEMPAAAAWHTPLPASGRSRQTAEPVALNGEGRMSAVALTTTLNQLLPTDRNVAVDGGGCLAHSVGLEPGDARGWLFPITYMSIGLGLSSGIGAAIAQPRRLTVIALGDACALSALADLETVARMRLPILIVIYNDAAHGGELELFKKRGYDVELMQFPDFDFAAVARGAGIQAATARSLTDLSSVSKWLEHRDGPFLLDAKIGVEPSEGEIFSSSSDWTTRLARSQGL